MPTQPTRLMADMAAAFARALAQSVKQLVAALGHAAGTEANVDLREAVAGERPASSVDSRRCRGLPAR